MVSLSKFLTCKIMRLLSGGKCQSIITTEATRYIWERKEWKHAIHCYWLIADRTLVLDVGWTGIHKCDALLIVMSLSEMVVCEIKVCFSMATREWVVKEGWGVVWVQSL